MFPHISIRTLKPLGNLTISAKNERNCAVLITKIALGIAGMKAEGIEINKKGTVSLSFGNSPLFGV
jgi:hypothetical protein